MEDNKLAICAYSQVMKLDDVYMTDNGLAGAVDLAVDTAGLAGILQNFPEAEGTIYGFVGFLPDRHPSRPKFWVLFPKLSEPQVHYIRPVSWALQWNRMTNILSAQYVLFMREWFQKALPDWLTYDIQTMYDEFMSVCDTHPWNLTVNRVVPRFTREDVVIDENTKLNRSVLSSVDVYFHDGSCLQLVAEHWPKMSEMGMMINTRRSDGDFNDDDVTTYALHQVGRG